MNTQIIGLTTPLMALVFFATFLLLWWRGKMDAYVLGFAASYLFFALGFAATHLLDPTSAYLFHVTQVLYTAGTVSLLWGATRRINQPLMVGPIVVTYVVAAIVLAIAVAVTDDVAPRLYIVNTSYGVMFAGGALTLLHSRRRELFDILVIALFVASAINFFIRPVLTLLVEQSIQASDYRDSVYYSVLNLALAIMSLMTAMTLVGACVSDLVSTIRDKSDRDLLTGLRNRRAFEADIDDLLDRARHDDVPASLVVADIDHFKQVNDLWGHQAGDQAIANFGKLIQTMVRDVDIVGRIGGEEFCILIWNCPENSAHKLAERIRHAFAQMAHDGISENIHLTASFGVTEWRSGEPYRKLFARADSYLYDAKENGRNKVVSAGKPADRKTGDRTASKLDAEAERAAAAA